MASFIMLSRCAGVNALRTVIGRRICTRVYGYNGGTRTISPISSTTAVLHNLGSFTARCNATAAALPGSSERRLPRQRGPSALPRNAVEEAIAESSTVEGQLRVLDDQVRRWGRVDREQVQQLLDLMLNAGIADTQQCVMLLRCTGSLLVKESSADRIKLCEQVCKSLETSGIKFNVQLYNALLRVKLENGQTFSPVEILNEMEVQKQLVPNRVTYQLLLSQFCELGDIEGASKILEHMKNHNLTINETVFNALVKGHIRKGDVAGANAVMKSMREAGLDPTADTYTVLMCGLAEKGDLNGIKKVISDARRDDVIITPRHIYSIILSLADKGHLQHIESMLEYIQSQTDMRYNQDALNCMFTLVAGGHDDAAFKVYMCMDRSNYVGQEATLGRVLLRNMVIKGRPVDKVIETWKKLREEKLSVDSLEEVANWAFRYQRAEYALQVLDHMKSLGFAIKQHYFWPVLNDAAKRSDVDSVIATVSRLISCMSEEDAVVGTVFRWAVKDLIDAGQKLDALVPRLKEVGMSESDVQIIEVASLVSRGHLAEATKLIERGTKFSPGILKAELVTGFVRSRFNAEELTQLLRVAAEKFGGSSLLDVNSGVLLGLLKRSDVKSNVTEQLIQPWIKNDLKMFKNYQTPIRNELAVRKLPQDLIQKLDELFVDESKAVEQISVENLRTASVEQLESWLEKSKKIRNSQSRTLEKWLLSKYCVSGMVKKADELKARLDSSGFVYTADTLRHLGTLAARHKANLEEALNYKQQIETQYPSYKLYAGLIINIAQLQMANGKFTDAVATLKDYAAKHGDQLHDGGFADGYQLSELGAKLIESCCKHCELPQALELVNILFDAGYVKAGTYSILDELVDGYVKKGDSDSVVSALENCVTRYNKAPNFSEVFRYLIAKEDAERLQKVVDLVTTIHGEMNILLRLAACFVECGKVKQARRILETPGLRALMRPLIDSCERFIGLDMEKELEQFVDITKNLFAVDRSEMLLQLMRLHAKRKDTQKMMEVFSLFEEEGILPKPHILRYVAKVLESAGQPVPFEVPPPPLQRESRQKQPTGPTAKADKPKEGVAEPKQLWKDEELQQVIESGDVSKLLEMKNRQLATDSVGFSSSVVKELCRRHELQVLRKLLNGLTEAGDIESLMAAKELNLPRSLAVYVHQCLFRANIHRNKTEEILDYLKTNVTDIPKYLSSGAFFLLAAKQPDLCSRVEGLAMDCIEQTNSPVVGSYLYNYYILSGQFDKVKQLLQKSGTFKDAVRLGFVCQQARRQQKEDVLLQVIDLHRTDNKRRLIVPYNHLLLLKCEQGEWQSTLQCYQSALKEGLTFDDLWVRSLQAMQAVALANKQPVPWPAGMLEKKSIEQAQQRRRQTSAVDSSSSSDSSDSDTAKVEKKK